MTTQYVLPYPRFRGYYPGTNIPLVGGKLYTLQPGTTGLGNLKATYNDSTGASPNANPVILDSNGEADIFGLGFYKLVLFDSLNNQIFSKDNIGLPAPGGGGSSVASQWQPSGLTPTYISATSFSFTGNQTALYFPGMRLQSTNNGGIVYSTIISSVFTSVTTITVVNDGTGAFDVGITSVNYGIITPQSGGSPFQNSSLPLSPVLVKASSITMSTMDLNQILELNNAVAQNYTLLAANLVPSGSVVKLKNIGAGAWTLIGTIDGLVNPVVQGGFGECSIYSDGTAWHFFYHASSATRTINTIPVSDASGNIAFPAVGLSMNGENAAEAFGANVTLNMGNVTAGDRIFVTGIFKGDWSATGPNMGGLEVLQDSGTATIIFGIGQSKISNYMTSINGVGSTYAPTCSGVILVTGTGSLVLRGARVTSGTITNQVVDLWAFFLKKN